MGFLGKFTIILSVLILVSCTSAPSTGVPQVISVNPIYDVDSHYVNFSIERVIVLGKPGDMFGQGEFRLFVIASDNEGRSSGMFCPSGAPSKINQGSAIDAPCVGGIYFDEGKMDEVFLMVFAVDEDKDTEVNDLAYQGLSIALGNGLFEALKAGKIIKNLKGPVPLPLSFLAGYLTGNAQQWVEKADVIGSMGIYLKNTDSWNEGEYVVVTGDGQLQISYNVSRTVNPKGFEIAANPTTTTLLPTLTLTPPPIY